MTGFLCALGIVGGTAFSIGMNDDSEAVTTTPLIIVGGSLMLVAGIGGLIRLAL